jgi:hypothetical protein
MQHQCCAEVLTTLSTMLGRLPMGARLRAEDAIRRTLSSLGDHVLTAPLDRALTRLRDALLAAGRGATAGELQRAHAAKATTIGVLNTRATRVPRDG